MIKTKTKILTLSARNIIVGQGWIQVAQPGHVVCKTITSGWPRSNVCTSASLGLRQSYLLAVDVDEVWSKLSVCSLSVGMVSYSSGPHYPILRRKVTHSSFTLTTAENNWQDSNNFGDDTSVFNSPVGFNDDINTRKTEPNT